MIQLCDDKGDTVIHRRAKQGIGGHVAQWLSGTVLVTQSTNKLGRTALREAVDKKHSQSVSEIVMKLDPYLPLKKTATLTEDLLAMCEKLPSALTRCIALLEDVD